MEKGKEEVGGGRMSFSSSVCVWPSKDYYCKIVSAFAFAFR